MRVRDRERARRGDGERDRGQGRGMKERKRERGKLEEEIRSDNRGREQRGGGRIEGKRWRV